MITDSISGRKYAEALPGTGIAIVWSSDKGFYQIKETKNG